MQAPFRTLCLPLCLVLALLHCGHWKPIEIALQPSLIKLQLCHKPHMKSTRGEESSGDARQVETRLVSSRVFRLVRKSCPIGHTHTLHTEEKPIWARALSCRLLELSALGSICQSRYLYQMWAESGSEFPQVSAGLGAQFVRLSQ